MKILKTLLLLGLFVVVARANDAATLEFLGFSKDGRFLAFMQYGTEDPTGFAYASLTVVDTAKNTVVRQANQRVERENAKITEAQAKLQTATLLRPYAILASNQGRFVGLSPQVPNHDRYQSQFVYNSRTYELELTSEFADVDAKVCPDALQSRLELKLTVAGKTRSLQKDGLLTGPRACARAYEMRHAHVLGNVLAVFVVVHVPGFEGSDLRWMVITAKL